MKSALSVKYPQDKVEYSLYVFDRTRPGRWEKHQSFSKEREALDHARHMLDTGKYPTIEIKKTYFDRRRRQKRDITFKTLGEKRGRPRSPFLTVGIAMAFGIIALVLTYLSSHG